MRCGFCSGSSQTFTFLFSDTSGAGSILWTQLMINQTLTTTSSRWFYYDGTLLYLYNDAGTGAGTVTIGSSGTASNSQCSVNGGASSVARSGNNLTMNLAVTFTSAFAGVKNTWMEAYDGTSSGWMQKGTWTVPGGGPPSPVSVTPSSGTGSSQNFSFVFTDPGGANNIIWTQIMINASLTTTSSCWFYYDGTLLYLYNDAGTGAGTVTIGSSGTASNSQCSVNGGASTVSKSGNNLTMNLALTFTSSFAGSKNTWMEVYDGLSSGWV